jgi:chemotaxis protein methyltransferase CheR
MNPETIVSETSNYRRFTDLVHDEIGVKLTESKRMMIESRLRRRMLALGYQELDDYLSFLFDENGLEDERDEIFDAVTTNKTDFFREADHFRALTQDVVPAFRRRGRRLLKLWSAAASTGAEAWTAAFVLAEAAREQPFEWAILGTDINTRVLARARRAIYPTEEISPVPREIRDRYLMRGKAVQSNDWRVVPELRRRAKFQRMNLMDPSWPIDNDIDVIFLRNVLIYFEPERQAAVIDRMSRHLLRGGHFFVGHSESMVVRNPTLRQVAPATFVKV